MQITYNLINTRACRYYYYQTIDGRLRSAKHRRQTVREIPRERVAVIAARVSIGPLPRDKCRSTVRQPRRPKLWPFGPSSSFENAVTNCRVPTAIAIVVTRSPSTVNDNFAAGAAAASDFSASLYII